MPPLFCSLLIVFIAIIAAADCYTPQLNDLYGSTYPTLPAPITTGARGIILGSAENDYFYDVVPDSSTPLTYYATGVYGMSSQPSNYGHQFYDTTNSFATRYQHSQMKYKYGAVVKMHQDHEGGELIIDWQQFFGETAGNQEAFHVRETTDGHVMVMGVTDQRPLKSAHVLPQAEGGNDQCGGGGNCYPEWDSAGDCDATGQSQVLIGKINKSNGRWVWGHKVCYEGQAGGGSGVDATWVNFLAPPIIVGATNEFHFCVKRKAQASEGHNDQEGNFQPASTNRYHFFCYYFDSHIMHAPDFATEVKVRNAGGGMTDTGVQPLYGLFSMIADKDGNVYTAGTVDDKTDFTMWMQQPVDSVEGFHTHPPVSQNMFYFTKHAAADLAAQPYGGATRDGAMPQWIRIKGHMGQSLRYVTNAPTNGNWIYSEEQGKLFYTYENTLGLYCSTAPVSNPRPCPADNVHSKGAGVMKVDMVTGESSMKFQNRDAFKHDFGCDSDNYCKVSNRAYARPSKLHDGNFLQLVRIWKFNDHRKNMHMLAVFDPVVEKYKGVHDLNQRTVAEGALPNGYEHYGATYDPLSEKILVYGKAGGMDSVRDLGDTGYWASDPALLKNSDANAVAAAAGATVTANTNDAMFWVLPYDKDAAQPATPPFDESFESWILDDMQSQFCEACPPQPPSCAADEVLDQETNACHTVCPV
tara:strand:- start:3345 stop:5432 length:2088 start_codon:yes stop_codon:yes gene_type:complete